MPRFHFNAFDGKAIKDLDGDDFSSIEEARNEALRLASELLSSSIAHRHLGEEWRVEVKAGGVAVLPIKVAMSGPALDQAALR